MHWFRIDLLIMWCVYSKCTSKDLRLEPLTLINIRFRADVVSLMLTPSSSSTRTFYTLYEYNSIVVAAMASHQNRIKVIILSHTYTYTHNIRECSIFIGYPRKTMNHHPRITTTSGFCTFG